MLKIYAPNKTHSGITAQVGFVNGIGYTEDEVMKEWFTKRGYKVEEVKSVDEEKSKLKDLQEQFDKLAEENKQLKAKLEEYDDDDDSDNSGDDTGGDKKPSNTKVKISK